LLAELPGVVLAVVAGMVLPRCGRRGVMCAKGRPRTCNPEVKSAGADRAFQVVFLSQSIIASPWYSSSSGHTSVAVPVDARSSILRSDHLRARGRIPRLFHVSVLCRQAP
jgi:hypothetical protein